MKVGTKWRAALLGFLAVMSGFGIVAPSTATAETAGSSAVSVGTSVVSGLFHTCVLMQDSTVKCWGSNENGQIGVGGNIGSQAAAFNPTPVASYTTPANASSIATGARHTCVLTTAGTVSCFGKNDFGQIGRDPSTVPDSQTPQTVAGLTNVTSLSSGDVFTCATKADGSVWCWGVGDNQQLGVAPASLPSITNLSAVTFKGSFTPVQVVGVTDAIAVDSGDAYACALKADGTVLCWGDNAVGQLGRSTQGGTSLAAAVPGLDRVAGLTSGRAHTCARKTSGAVFCWGGNDSGQLGVGDTSPRFAPEILPTLGSVRSVAASQDTTCGVRATGTAVCWGSNTKGQLGNGTTTDAPLPVDVPNLTNAAVIAPGWTHTCALLLDGTMKCWGANDRGQMGNGTGGLTTSPNVLSPQAVPNLTAVKLDPGTVVTPGPTPAPVVTDQPFTALAKPERLLDTRSTGNVVDGNAEYQRTGPVGNVPKVVKIAGRGTTPSGMASAVLNVTAVNAGQDGYVTVWPCDQNRPNASSLNYKAGDTVANAVMTKLDGSGNVCLFAETPVELLIDAAGYFPTTSSFTPLAAPQRILETRAGAVPTVDLESSNQGRLTAGSTYTLRVAGRAGVPGGATSAALNVTAINGGGDGGYLTAYPCDAARPDASNVNIADGQNIPNLVVSKLSSDGKVCIFTFKDVDLAVDVVGYFSTSVSYTPLSAPARFMDTRSGGRTADGVAAGPTALTLDGVNPYELLVGGRNGISSSAGSVLMNVTVAEALGAGFVTVYPCGQTRPDASNVNYKSGQTIANSVAAGIGTGRKVCIYSSSPTSILVDVAGTLS